MNVFPLISLAFIVHRIPSVAHSQGDPQRAESSHLWSRCYDDLGCVNNTEEWYHGALRPLKGPPLPRHIIKTTFILFTKGKDPRHSVVVEPLFPTTKHILASSFDATRPRAHLLIHDFTSNGMAGWIKHAVKSLLVIDAGNVISVDWTGGAEPPYATAVQNARVVALEVAALLNTLLNNFSGIDPGKLHLIGQGLGAHIAGYVGQKINGVGRITGLDPLGLYFKDMPPSTRLDPEDATFVDVINTDVEAIHGQGSGEPFGHLNFFPNGGLTQPGCNLTSLYPNLDEILRDTLTEGRAAPGCNHKRAAKYFTASIDERNIECPQMGYACGDYQAFKRAECLANCKEGSSCSPMGYFADVGANDFTVLTTTKFFLDTNASPSYCMFAYKIVVSLGPSEESVEASKTPGGRTLAGSFYVTVFSEGEKIVLRTTLNLGDGKKALITDGDNVFLAYQRPPKMTKPDKMVLLFDSEINETSAVYVRRVKMSNLPDWGDPLATYFCGREDVTELRNHVEANFTPCDKTRFISDEPGATFAPPFREKRSPGEEPPQSETIEESEYDESEIPEPAEDDYYSNR